MADFLLPDLGEGLTEAEIVRWLVEVGDEITVDQPVVEVETAKAAVEVPAPFAGTVTARHGEPGQTLPVGTPLITVEQAGGFREPGVVTGSEGSGNVLIGYGTPTASRRRRRRVGSEQAVPEQAVSEQAVAQHTAPQGGGHSAERPTRSHNRRPAVISPLVRKIARDNGIDLTTVAGSGPGGIIRRTDIEAVLAARTGASESRDERKDDRRVDRQGGLAAEPRDGERRIPLRGLRRAVAEKLRTSRREIPEATVWVDVDATELVATRAALNERNPERPLSLLSLLARFTVAGLRRYPELNSRVEQDEIVVLDAVHLGFAAQTERGLVVPVVHDAHRLTTRELAEAIGRRTASAMDGTLGPAELTGGTFTVNNYGVFGVDGSAAIINHPEVAILGMGRIIERPWVHNGQVVPRTMCQLTLAFDHRVCDGGTAGGFLRFVADCVESPVTALGDL
ncbi:dihydrolipoamide acetyltransferase family protein [Saccharomonospora xinjiangensis]|uniref:Dihydrolipoamide acetyltransferase component of pyruvate dehydrogenase complex n=1 Tax=Saccharomonospora xinjiangensis XJ-54 TaxID=882086 RepID=I0V4H3_9PSEU|nr:dihydrolipoamide acetyltransferase family protein [Saccharomonospora xinjiangensis]EID55026.1 pyruvate/2-oxoglutarate dehydrogenase complex, dihydrolipoamide acyltransferase component [Saccharomonospora xinjiangensis XJ-54]